MNEEIDPIAERLERERLVPTDAFRGELRRHLAAEAGARPRAPRRLRLLITAYAGRGVVLLAIAAVGLAGVGPFAS